MVKLMSLLSEMLISGSFMCIFKKKETKEHLQIDQNENNNVDVHRASILFIFSQ